MNEGYTDHTKWTEVKCWEDQYYLDENKPYRLRDTNDLFSKLLLSAQDKGLYGCHLKFSSHTDYDDYLSAPSVVAVGYRPLNDDEKQEAANRVLVENLAKDKGISFYEANLLKSLIDRGVI